MRMGKPGVDSTDPLVAPHSPASRGLSEQPFRWRCTDLRDPDNKRCLPIFWSHGNSVVRTEFDRPMTSWRDNTDDGPAYRAYELDESDHVVNYTEIHELSDAAALARMEQIANSRTMELWDRGRLIGRVGRALPQ